MGLELDLTPERIRQMEAKALCRLRKLVPDPDERPKRERCPHHARDWNWKAFRWGADYCGLRPHKPCIGEWLRHTRCARWAWDDRRKG